jgi:glycosyltransferase involved in cell wall biosynthesis
MPLDAISPRPRRVLMSADAMGGIWTYALELAGGLDRLGIDTHLAVLGPAPTPAQRAEAQRIRHLDVSVTGLPLDWTARSETAFAEVPEALKAIAVRSGADLVHLNAPAHAGAVPWSRPLVVSVHSSIGTWWRTMSRGPLPADLAWRARRARAGLAVADTIIAPSQSFARALVETYGPTLPVVAVPNGRRRGLVNCHRQRRRLLTAGRLWDRAEDIGTIDAASAMSSVVIHAAGPMCGPSGERVQTEHLATLGPLSAAELARWYAETAIFISASRYEPFGLAVLEAAQAGAALVLSDIETFRELWDGAALFFPAGDASALAAVLSRLRENEPLRRQLASRAMARARDWSADRMIKATLGVYAQALSVHAGREPPRTAV